MSASLARLPNMDQVPFVVPARRSISTTRSLLGFSGSLELPEGSVVDTRSTRNLVDRVPKHLTRPPWRANQPIDGESINTCCRNAHQKYCIAPLRDEIGATAVAPG